MKSPSDSSWEGGVSGSETKDGRGSSLGSVLGLSVEGFVGLSFIMAWLSSSDSLFSLFESTFSSSLFFGSSFSYDSYFYFSSLRSFPSFPEFSFSGFICS
jgi:hypothetical protein